MAAPLAGASVHRRCCCAKCDKQSESLKVCARCKSVRYCNEQCQRAHWPTHKQTCQPPPLIIRKFDTNKNCYVCRKAFISTMLGASRCFRHPCNGIRTSETYLCSDHCLTLHLRSHHSTRTCAHCGTTAADDAGTWSGCPYCTRHGHHPLFCATIDPTYCLRRHIAEAHENDRISCHVCKRKEFSERGLTTFYKQCPCCCFEVNDPTVNTNNRYCSDECLQTHVMSKHPGRMELCTTCGGTYLGTDERWQKCTECTTRLCRVQCLQFHENSCHPGLWTCPQLGCRRRYVAVDGKTCDFCDVTRCSDACLEQHKRAMHKELLGKEPAKSTVVTAAVVAAPAEKFTCVVCLSAERTVLFVACRHLCCCATCLKTLQADVTDTKPLTCPVCRTEAKGANGVMHVFLS